MRCQKHPRYRGKNKPRCKCFQCWGIWLSKRPMGQIRWKTLTIREIGVIMDLVKDYFR